MKACIKGIGWVTAAGIGIGAETEQNPFCQGELNIPTRRQIFSKADMRFGRLDPFSRIGLAAIALCLRDAEREDWDEKRPIGIVTASRFGCLQTDLAYLETMLPDQGKLASPNLFAYTLPNCFLGEAALRFGLSGSSVVLNQADDSRLTAIRYALEELEWSAQEGVLAGVCDLNPPSGLEDDSGLPGSLFILLEKSPQPHSYGDVELNDDRVLFNGVIIDNLDDLITACLAAKKN